MQVPVAQTSKSCFITVNIIIDQLSLLHDKIIHLILFNSPSSASSEWIWVKDKASWKQGLYKLKQLRTLYSELPASHCLTHNAICFCSYIHLIMLTEWTRPPAWWSLMMEANYVCLLTSSPGSNNAAHVFDHSLVVTSKKNSCSYIVQEII